MSKSLDLTNKRFGKLVALYPLEERKNGRRVWHCRCDCGNEKDIIVSNLTNGYTQSCGCLQKEKTSETNRKKGLEGKQFGYLTVIEWDKEKHKWKCQCKCGNITYVDTNHLNQGHTRSCGCLQKQRASQVHFTNLTGKKFGLLTVLGLNEEKSSPELKVYKCKCDCGNECDVRMGNLISGTTQTCGCKKMSHGEIKISQILTDYNIPFEREKTFEGCINPKTGNKLRFDFFINNKYLIEYNGKQHYKNDNNWNNNNEDFQELQYRDILKIEWAKKNNIPLIIIPYTSYDKLTIDDLLLSK